MYYYVLYGIIALNMVPLRGKHSRKFVAACTALYMIVVYSLNVYSPDQTIYSQYYSTGQTDNYFEWIYLALGSICLQIGLSYQMFKLLHCLFTVFSVCTLCKAADYEDVKSLLFFWLLSVFCIQSEQSRFFLASMISRGISIVSRRMFLRPARISFSSSANTIVIILILPRFRC